MKDIINETSKMILDEEAEKLVEMSNLVKRKTGLPVIIWVDDIGDNRNNKHFEPRIKMQNDYGDRANSNTISISIDKTNPTILAGELQIKNSDFKLVQEWIIKNYNALMEYWKGEIDIEEFKDKVFIV